MKIKLDQNLSICIVVITIGLLLFHHFFYFYGHFGYDDMHYARLSNNLLQGEIDWSDHYSYRFTILSLTAISYSIFGINDFSSGLPALLLSFGIIGIFYSAFSKRPLLLVSTLAIYFSYKWNLFFSDKLMPDLYVSFFSLIGWYCYYLFHQKDSNNKWLPIISAIGIFLAFNSKGTIILLLPLFAYYFIKDLAKRSLNFWRLFSPTLLVLLLSYSGLMKYATGKMFARFDAILSNQYINDCSYDQLGVAHLLDRLGPQFWNLLKTEVLYIPIIIGLIAILFRYKLIASKKSISFDTLTVLILILSVNFMSISLNSYNPICIDPRHILFITPIIAICISNLIGSIIDHKSKYLKYMSTGIIIGSALILIPTWKYAQYCKSINYKEIRKSYLAIAKNNTLRGKIICSPTFKNYLEYYSEYNPNMLRSYHSINEIDKQFVKQEFLLIATNWFADWNAGMDGGKLELMAGELGAEINEEIIYSNEHVVVYSLNKKGQLQ